MDQDTSNSPGKARWRERLGMGTSGKDLPKISDEFKPAAAPAKPAPQRPQPSAQGHQPVTRPAPMAPRTPAPMAPRVPPRAQAPAPQGQPRSQPPQQQRPVAPLPQGAAGLGDRLRAERQAAERLAEQRVAQARGGNRPMAPAPAQPAPQPAAPAPQSQRPAQPERPKFSFSAEELAKDKRESVPTPPPPPAEREYPTFSGKAGGASAPPPLTPPRPALGGNAAVPPPRPQPPKPQASPPPSAGPAFQPRYGAPPQQPQAPAPNYRSLDPPAGGSFTPKSRPYADTAAFREDPLARREAPLPPPRPQAPVNREYDSYRRPPALPPVSQQAYGDELDGPALPDYRRRPPVPARGRQQPAPAYDEDVNEVFEDEEPPRPQRRRASAQDYNRAYRDYEEGYEAEPRRRRGPWPWLLAILLGGIVLTGGIIYYYLTYMKNPGQANGGNVPVIEAPDSSSKTAPENTGGSLGNAPGTNANPTTDAQRKQIYDRILGDDEVNGNQNQVVPTQEQPQAVEPAGGNEGQGAAPLPTPSSGTQDNSSEPLPLPLPPPGATDQQGSLQGQTNQQTAAMGAVERTTAPAPEPASTTASDGGAPVPGQLAKATEQIASAPPPAAEQVVSEPEELPPQPQPAKPKLKAEKKPVKKTAAVEDAVDTGTEGAVEPLVLVPPAQQPVVTTQTPIAQPEPAPVQQATESAASEPKSKSFFNSLGSGPTGKRKLTGKAAENAQARGGATGNWANAPDPNAVQADSSGAEPQQIAAITPAPEPQPIPAPEPEQPAQKAKPSSGGGFTAQLASFRSEAEAQAEFDRLRAKHGGVLGGFSPRIVKATVAGSPRYRLSVGPMASRAQASKVCDSLIAGGERDCLVRGN
ncbi:MAG: SPOR domain-containing protein [Pseudomonadota bacterium]